MNALVKFLVGLLLLVPALSVSAHADHDDHYAHTHHAYHAEHAYPYYGSIGYSGYGYQSYTYGWQGWNWNRVYYRYHAPYYTQHVIDPIYYGPPSPYNWYW